jgi:hypothetical protein
MTTLFCGATEFQMKPDYSITLKFILLLCILFSIVGCFLTIKVEQIHNSPTLILNATSTQLPLEGKIAFIRFDDNGIGKHIYVMNAIGKGINDITPPSINDISDLSMSLDGAIIVFSASKDGVKQIFSMKVDGTDLKQLTFTEQNSYRPSLSPDKRSIIFESSNKKYIDNRGVVSQQAIIAQQIYMMQADGSDIHRLINNDKLTLTGYYRTDGYISVSEPITRNSIKNYIVNSNGQVQSQFPEW